MDNVIIYDKLEELNEGIEYNGGGITELLNGRIVKSVQRGRTRNTITNGSPSKSVNITSVNLSKSILIANLYISGDSFGSYLGVTLSSANQITVSIEEYASNNVSISYTLSWQVIEFY